MNVDSFSHRIKLFVCALIDVHIMCGTKEENTKLEAVSKFFRIRFLLLGLCFSRIP